MLKIRLKRIVSLLVAFSLVMVVLLQNGNVPSQRVYGATLSELQKKQQQIKDELNQAKKNLASLENDIDKEEDYQNELSYKISLNKQQIQNMEAQISLLEEDIAAQNLLIGEKQSEIEEKQLEIDETYEAFKKRIKSMYMAGEASALEMLFSSESFSEFFTTVKLMRAVSEHDEQLVQDLKQKKQNLEYEVGQLEAYVAQVEADAAEIETQKTEIEAVQVELQDAYSKSKTAMQDLDILKSRYESDLDAVKAKEDAIEAELQEWYRQQYANSNQGSLSDSAFIWPLPGYSYISSGFGMRWGAMHRGIDITGGGCYGANIVASSSGTVITSTWHYSYGYYVIIDHGGGYSTLYAHCSQLLVSVGDTVAKGQAIAKVGSTGDSTGPHLHFEVRVNGTANNPLNFVSYS